MKPSIKDLVEEIFNLCAKKNIKICTVESCTGGSIASILTSLPGSSKFFDRGLVTYSNTSKINLLNINPEVLKSYGAVSHETALLMVESQNKLNTVTIATTGILGPDSDSTNKPIGLIYIATHYDNETRIKELSLSGTRDTIKEQVILHSLELCLETIS